MTDEFATASYKNALQTMHPPQWLEEIEGWISTGELTVLAFAASQVPTDKRIVDLGTYRGKSALALAWGSKQGNSAPVYTIDPHLIQKGRSGEQYGPADMEASYRNIVTAPNNLAQLIYCTCLSGADASRTFSENSVGLLFIDALHETSAVISDWLAWQHTLANNATVLLHDSNYITVQNGIAGIHARGYNLRPIVKGASIEGFLFTRNTFSLP